MSPFPVSLHASLPPSFCNFNARSKAVSSFEGNLQDLEVKASSILYLYPLIQGLWVRSAVRYQGSSLGRPQVRSTSSCAGKLLVWVTRNPHRHRTFHPVSLHPNDSIYCRGSRRGDALPMRMKTTWIAIQLTFQLQQSWSSSHGRKWGRDGVRTGGTR